MIDLARHPASFRAARKTWSAHFELGDTLERSDLNLHAVLSEFAQGLDVDRTWAMLLSAVSGAPTRLLPGSQKVLIVATSWHLSHLYVQNFSFTKVRHRNAIDRIASDLIQRTAGMNGALDGAFYERIATDAWIFHHEHLGAGRHRGG